MNVTKRDERNETFRQEYVERSITDVLAGFVESSDGDPGVSGLFYGREKTSV